MERNVTETDPWAAYDRMFSPEYAEETEEKQRRWEAEEQAVLERGEAEREERKIAEWQDAAADKGDAADKGGI